MEYVKRHSLEQDAIYLTWNSLHQISSDDKATRLHNTKQFKKQQHFVYGPSNLFLDLLSITSPSFSKAIWFSNTYSLDPLFKCPFSYRHEIDKLIAEKLKILGYFFIYKCGQKLVVPHYEVSLIKTEVDYVI